MDVLTHLCLPISAAYVLREDYFDHPLVFGLAGLGLLSDFDKFLGMPGLLHSLVTLVPICGGLLGLEYLVRGRLEYAPLAVALVLSHLVLDFIDGGPVPLLFPFIETGVGIQYPAQTVFGSGPVGMDVQGSLVSIRAKAPRQGFNQYGFINGAGVASALLFVTVLIAAYRDRFQSGWRSLRGTE